MNLEVNSVGIEVGAEVLVWGIEMCYALSERTGHAMAIHGYERPEYQYTRSTKK